jgi:hypothetical protein
MSSRSINATKMVRGPNCPHCSNLGLNSNHWLRKTPEANSPVVCPVLLATNCTYCNKSGHTAGYCQLKKQEMKNADKEIRTAKYFEKTTCVVEKAPIRAGFAVLEETSIEKAKTKTITKQVGEKRTRNEMDFPELVPHKTNHTKTENLAFSYLEMAAKPVVEEKIVYKEKPKVSKPVMLRKICASWADDDAWASSDDGYWSDEEYCLS